VIRLPILPACLDLFPGITFPPISAHVVTVPPSLTMPSTMILVRVSHSHDKCILVPLDVLPSPLSSCLQKQLIVQNDPANRYPSWFQCWRCGHPKARSVCKPDGSLIFMACCRCNIFPGGSRISIEYGSSSLISIDCCGCSRFLGGSRISIA
jgi:hypothetical protein